MKLPVFFFNLYYVAYTCMKNRIDGSVDPKGWNSMYRRLITPNCPTPRIFFNCYICIYVSACVQKNVACTKHQFSHLVQSNLVRYVRGKTFFFSRVIGKLQVKNMIFLRHLFLI